MNPCGTQKIQPTSPHNSLPYSSKLVNGVAVINIETEKIQWIDPPKRYTGTDSKDVEMLLSKNWIGQSFDIVQSNNNDTGNKSFTTSTSKLHHIDSDDNYSVFNLFSVTCKDCRDRDMEKWEKKSVSVPNFVSGKPIGSIHIADFYTLESSDIIVLPTDPLEEKEFFYCYVSFVYHFQTEYLTAYLNPVKLPKTPTESTGNLMNSRCLGENSYMSKSTEALEVILKSIADPEQQLTDTNYASIKPNTTTCLIKLSRFGMVNYLSRPSAMSLNGRLLYEKSFLGFIHNEDVEKLCLKISSIKKVGFICSRVRVVKNFENLEFEVEYGNATVVGIYFIDQPLFLVKFDQDGERPLDLEQTDVLMETRSQRQQERTKQVWMIHLSSVLLHSHLIQNGDFIEFAKEHQRSLAKLSSNCLDEWFLSVDLLKDYLRSNEITTFQELRLLIEIFLTITGLKRYPKAISELNKLMVEWNQDMSHIRLTMIIDWMRNSLSRYNEFIKKCVSK